MVRAAVLSAPGARPEIVDVELDDPRTGEVEVAITAAGVCGSDLHVVAGDWEVPMPVVLGHEGAGVVTRIGPDVDDLEPGDHVVLSWVPQCGRCRQCEAGRPWQCELVANVVAPGGVLHDGTSRWHGYHHYLGVSSFAERVVVPRSGAVKIRDDAPLDVVAVVGCAVATGVGAVQNTAQVPPGASVAVIGCGGVGLSVIQGARLAGAARIVACDTNPAKHEVARRVGATEVVDAAAELSDFDFVFDAIGRIETTEQAIAALGLGGAAVVVGLPPTGPDRALRPARARRVQPADPRLQLRLGRSPAGHPAPDRPLHGRRARPRRARLRPPAARRGGRSARRPGRRPDAAHPAHQRTDRRCRPALN